jgi:hypothetical protein
MSRDLSSAIEAEVQTNSIIPYFLSKINTNAGDVLTWSGYGDFISTVAGSTDTYIGVGELGVITNVQESTDLAARGMSLSLSGIPSARISQALSELEQGRLVQVFMGFFDDSTRLPIATEFEIFTGVVDVPSISESGSNATITIAAENRLLDLERVRVRRYTQEDQARDDVTDLGFEFVPSLQDKEVLFGSAR